MLICVWGHSAIGKTTWLESIQDDLRAINRKIVLVYADVQLERRPFKDGWFDSRHSRWKGEKQERQAILPTMIADSKIWILESMRWFIGMQPDLTAGFKANGNSGLHMIILHSDLDVQKLWRLERCQLLGKPWNTYWDKLGNLKVENNRGRNSIIKHFQPAGVPCKAFKIGYERKEFAEVTAYIKGIIQP